jgi:hypothetical protein
MNSLGKAGVGYSVFDVVNTMENHDGVVGNLQISQGGNLSVAFSRHVDLRIEPPDLPVDPRSSLWNSEHDFGRFTCSPGAVVTVDDPASEIRLTELSAGSFRWEFLKSAKDERRFPANQTWAIRIERTDVFTISKSPESIGRAAFRFHVASSSRVSGPKEEPEPAPSGEGRSR